MQHLVADPERRQSPLELTAPALPGEGQQNFKTRDRVHGPLVWDVIGLNSSKELSRRHAKLFAAAFVKHRACLLDSQLNNCAAAPACVGDGHDTHPSLPPELRQ